MTDNLPECRKDEYETALDNLVKSQGRCIEELKKNIAWCSRCFDEADKRLKIVEEKLNKRGRPPKEN